MGCPLHIEELIAAARRRAGRRGRRSATRPCPDTIEDAVLARTADARPDAQAVARAGAVIGRCFVPEVLAGVMDRPVAELEDALQELVDHGFLYEFGTVDEGYYDFRHQLLRDALYRSTPERDRRRYHARAGGVRGAARGRDRGPRVAPLRAGRAPREAYRAARSAAQRGGSAVRPPRGLRAVPAGGRQHARRDCRTSNAPSFSSATPPRPGPSRRTRSRSG